MAIALVWTFLFNPSIRFTESEVVLEKGEVYFAQQFVQKANGTVTPEQEQMDTATIGAKELVYTVQKGPFRKEHILSYEVVDTRPPQLSVLSSSIQVEAGTSLTEEWMKENISVDEGTLTFSTDYDATAAGYYTVSVKAVDESGNESSCTYEVVVEDREAPLVFRNGDGTQIELGEEFQLGRTISYGDNTDPAPVLETEGRVNTAQVGKYPIRATLTDASGNQTKWSFTVEVVEEVPEPEDDNSYYAFSDFMADHAGPNRQFGIDVSRWQGDIDFQKVKEAGCAFVIMRIGYSEEGVFSTDTYFRQNFENAKKVGLPIGIYLFSYDNNEEDVRSSARMMFEELGEETLQMPVVFDWENFYYFQNYGISFQQLNHLYDVFAEEVTNRGYDCMLYGSKTYLQSVWKHTDSRPVWLAHFTSKTTYEGPYRIWQASARGRIPGIDGYVDMNILYE